MNIGPHHLLRPITTSELNRIELAKLGGRETTILDMPNIEISTSNLPDLVSSEEILHQMIHRGCIPSSENDLD